MAAPSLPTQLFHLFCWCNLLITDKAREETTFLQHLLMATLANHAPQLSSLEVQYSRGGPAPCGHFWQTPNHIGNLSGEGGAIVKDTIGKPIISFTAVR